jgi:hypothetical protein
VVTNPESAAAKAFLAVAEQVAAALDKGETLKPPPRIVWED